MIHRSQSALGSLIENKDNTTKKSLWGTIKNKRRADDISAAKRKSYIKFRPLSVVSSSSSITTTDAPVSSTDVLGGKVKNGNAQHLRNVSSHSSISVGSSSTSGSRPVSMISHSLDPAASRRDSGSPYTSQQNLTYTPLGSSKTTAQAPHNTNHGHHYAPAHSKASDVDKSDLSQTPRQIRRGANHNKSKRYSVMLSNDIKTSDLFSSLRAVSPNGNQEECKEVEEELDSVQEKDSNTSNDSHMLSAAFEDYKLALEAYGTTHSGVTNFEDKEGQEYATKNSSSYSVATSTIHSGGYLSSSPSSLSEEKMQIKVFSNCIWIGSCQSSIFDKPDSSKDEPLHTCAKLEQIDIKIDQDLDDIFTEHDDDEDFNFKCSTPKKQTKKQTKRIIQRTSLYFT